MSSSLLCQPLRFPSLASRVVLQRRVLSYNRLTLGEGGSSRSSTTTGSGSSGNAGKAVFLASVVSSSLAILFVTSSEPIHNDAATSSSSLHSGKDHLGIHLWGSNRFKLIDEADAATFRKPKYLAHTSGRAYRDFRIHERYAAVVDQDGDILQWGTGYSPGSKGPSVTLRGQNIVQLALTSDKIYARTKSGDLLVLPAAKKDQTNTANSALPSTAWYWKLIGYHDPGVHFEKIKLPQDHLTAKVASIDAGRNHLLALLDNGKACCVAVNADANECGQLGGSKLMPQIDNTQAATSLAVGEAQAPKTSAVASNPSSTLDTNLIAPANPSPAFTYFDTQLKVIPALRNLTVDQLKAGDRHSLAKTVDGRVFGWGNNSLGQLALGSSMAFPTIPGPTECSLSASYSKSSRITCSKLFAGGDNSYFIVYRQDISPAESGDEEDEKNRFCDLIAAGNGMYGGIGNGQWNSTSSPIRVKTISGNKEYDEHSGRFRPIEILDVDINSTHTAVVLDNAYTDPQDKRKFGNDIYLFGHNDQYQLGTTKRNNLNIPQHLPPLPYPSTSTNKPSEKQESTLDSGVKTHMPHNRMQLNPKEKIGKHVMEEKITAGYGVTGVWWKLDP